MPDALTNLPVSVVNAALAVSAMCWRADSVSPRSSASSALSGDVQGFVSPTSGGGNVLHSNLILPGAGDINVVNQAALGLGSLASSGGVTQTFLPQPGSPLLDRVPVCVLNADARAAPRPASGSPLCDTGAVERQPVEIAGLIYRDGFE